MKKQFLAALWLLCVPGLAAAEHAYTFQEVVYAKGLGLKGYLAYPKGEGPFPVVVYHHGGLGNRMFFELGAYWKEVIAFLDEQIGTGPKPGGGNPK
jgi:hypothetical protein